MMVSEENAVVRHAMIVTLVYLSQVLNYRSY
jgi:hypothetical protein